MASNSRIIRLIALFKLLKACTLVVLGISSLKLIHSDLSDSLSYWVRHLGFDPGNKYISIALQKSADISPEKIRDLGLVSFIYALLFLIEGTGLWLQKRWAEWFTVIITGSLVPLEAYELFRHPTAVKGIVLIINLSVVAYLIYRIRTENSSARH